jgi:hypothetical protein
MPAKGWRKPAKPLLLPTVIYITCCSDCGKPTHPAKLRRAGPSLLCIECHRLDREAIRQEARQQAIEEEARRQRDQAALTFLTALAERRMQKGKGVMGMPEEYAVKVAKLPDRIAAIAGKTYARMQDGYKLADDEALGMICDLLDELDPMLIERNQHKRLRPKA